MKNLQIAMLEHCLTDKQKRFCDEYLVSFNAYRACLAAGYSKFTASKGEILHLEHIQEYLAARMARTAERLEISHDMILRELAKVAFSSMGDYYDTNGQFKPMHYLSESQKAAISHYQIANVRGDDGRIHGELCKIKLHNKMAALDRIARHVGFYGVAGKSSEYGAGSPESGVLKKTQESRPKNPADFDWKKETCDDGGAYRAEGWEGGPEPMVESPESPVLSPEPNIVGGKPIDDIVVSLAKPNSELPVVNSEQPYQYEMWEEREAVAEQAADPVLEELQPDRVEKVLTISPLLGVENESGTVENIPAISSLSVDENASEMVEKVLTISPLSADENATYTVEKNPTISPLSVDENASETVVKNLTISEMPDEPGVEFYFKNNGPQRRQAAG